MLEIEQTAVCETGRTIAALRAHSRVAVARAQALRNQFTPEADLWADVAEFGGHVLIMQADQLSSELSATLLPAESKDQQNPEPKPTFHCPLWPGCDCPAGEICPECPNHSIPDQHKTA